MRLEGALQIARMIMHLKHARDQGRDAREGPALGGKTGCHRAPVQEPTQPGPGLLIEPGRSSRDGPGLQAAPALLGQRGRPAADTGAADPQLPGNLGLGEPSLPQQRRGRQTALLQLL
jgi:hypothetical protein